MAGRFEGLSDLEWKLFEDIFPTEPEKRRKGMPHVPYRHVLNSLLYILITGCRWCDLPRGNVWASKSASHRWLKRWRSMVHLNIYKHVYWRSPTKGDL